MNQHRSTASANPAQSYSMPLDQIEMIAHTARSLRRESWSNLEQAFFAGAIAPAELSIKLAEASDQYVLRYALREIGVLDIIRSEQLAVAGLGGYGAGTYAKRSDIDTILISRGKFPDSLSGRLNTLRDIGEAADHAVEMRFRSISDLNRCWKAREFTTLTALLSLRFIEGDRETFEKYRSSVGKLAVNCGAELVQLIAESVAQREKGSRRFFCELESNFKNARGGLRDLDAVRWLETLVRHKQPQAALLAPAQQRELDRASELLLKVKHILHFGAGSFASDEIHLLTPAKARSINALCFGGEGELSPKKMRELYDASAAVARHLDAALHYAALVFPPRRAAASVIGPASDPRFDAALEEARRNPKLIFSIADDSGMRVGAALRKLSREGELVRLVPAVRYIEHVPEYNGFQTLTLDEHAIQTVEILDHLITAYPRLPDLPVIDLTFDRAPLYLAALLQNVMKPDESSESDHYVMGAAVTKCEALNLGFSQEQAVRAASLVKNHSLLARLSQHELIHQSARFSEAAAEIGDFEQLSQLFLLTLAHKNAANPERWTAAKQSWLIQTFHGVARNLPGIERVQPRFGALDASASADPRGESRSEEIEEFARSIDPLIRDLYDPAILERQYLQVCRLREQPSDGSNPRVYAELLDPDRASGSFRLIVAADDRPGLLRTLTRRLEQLRLNLCEALVATTTDGIAFDSFLLAPQMKRTPDELRAVGAKIETTVRDFVAGKTLDLGVGQRRFAEPPLSPFLPSTPRVLVDSYDGGRALKVQVMSNNRVGLDNDLDCFETRNLRVLTARLGTGNRGISDVFVVQNCGSDFTTPERIAELRSDLFERLGT